MSVTVAKERPPLVSKPKLSVTCGGLVWARDVGRLERFTCAVSGSRVLLPRMVMLLNFMVPYITGDKTKLAKLNFNSDLVQDQIRKNQNKKQRILSNC